MAKKFFYVCAGIFLLAGMAQAVPVDPNAPDGVVAYWTISDPWRAVILCTDGNSFELHDDGGGFYSWTAFDVGLPVEVSEIADWTPRAFRTHAGLLYLSASTSSGHWVRVGEGISLESMPCTEMPVSSEQTTLGGVKGQFR